MAWLLSRQEPVLSDTMLNNTAHALYHPLQAGNLVTEEGIFQCYLTKNTTALCSPIPICKHQSSGGSRGCVAMGGRAAAPSSRQKRSCPAFSAPGTGRSELPQAHKIMEINSAATQTYMLGPQPLLDTLQASKKKIEVNQVFYCTYSNLSPWKPQGRAAMGSRHRTASQLHLQLLYKKLQLSPISKDRTAAPYHSHSKEVTTQQLNSHRFGMVCVGGFCLVVFLMVCFFFVRSLKAAFCQLEASKQ